MVSGHYSDDFDDFDGFDDVDDDLKLVEAQARRAVVKDSEAPLHQIQHFDMRRTNTSSCKLFLTSKSSY